MRNLRKKLAKSANYFKLQMKNNNWIILIVVAIIVVIGVVAIYNYFNKRREYFGYSANAITTYSISESFANNYTLDKEALVKSLGEYISDKRTTGKSNKLKDIASKLNRPEKDIEVAVYEMDERIYNILDEMQNENEDLTMTIQVIKEFAPDLLEQLYVLYKAPSTTTTTTPKTTTPTTTTTTTTQPKTNNPKTTPTNEPKTSPPVYSRDKLYKEVAQYIIDVNINERNKEGLNKIAKLLDVNKNTIEDIVDYMIFEVNVGASLDEVVQQLKEADEYKNVFDTLEGMRKIAGPNNVNTSLGRRTTAEEYSFGRRTTAEELSLGRRTTAGPNIVNTSLGRRTTAEEYSGNRCPPPVVCPKPVVCPPPPPPVVCPKPVVCPPPPPPVVCPPPPPPVVCPTPPSGKPVAPPSGKPVAPPSGKPVAPPPVVKPVAPPPVVKPVAPPPVGKKV